MNMKNFKSKAKSILTLLVLGIVAIYQYLQEDNSGKNTNNNAAVQQQEADTAQQISIDKTTPISNIKQWKSGKWVILSGHVSRILPDDNKGSRHQKFILKLSNNKTLLVAHNIDLADRVPLDRGDTIKLRGRYEKNDRGGVVHWTHHDPQRTARAGWIEHAGITYE